MNSMNVIPAQNVTVKQEFECVYFLQSSERQKIDINAHRYRVEVSVRRIDGVYNRIVEFSELQEILKSVLPDGKYLYSSENNDTPYMIGTLLKNTDNSDCTIKVKFVLCAENICNWIAQNLQEKLDLNYAKKLEVTDVVLRENSQCFVNWHRVENKE